MLVAFSLPTNFDAHLYAKSSPLDMCCGLCCGHLFAKRKPLDLCRGLCRGYLFAKSSPPPEVKRFRRAFMIEQINLWQCYVGWI